MVADDYPAGPMFVSTNSGVTWRPAGISGHSWTSVASSADGTKLIATANEFPTGPVFKSSNSGVTWTQISVPAASWIAAASSADGSRMIIAGNNPPDGPVYASTDSASNWAFTGAPSENYTAVASSADGATLALASAYINGVSGSIHISTNSGVTWNNSDAPVSAWSSVAASVDGKKLVAAVNGGGIFVWSQPGPVPPPVLNGSVVPFTALFQLRFDGVVNGLYNVLASTNVLDWSVIGSATETAPGQFEFNDTDAPNHSSRLYRVSSP
ncbi:MAG: hypothetical protein NT154_16130 [Verrucomicrobia bacterium]|nr:hypothetical protein [Verrucomicrobiota bacterium]